MVPQSGKFLVIEGIEGAGKSTALNTVMSYLAEQGIKAISTREPGGTAVGETLRLIFKNIEYKQSLDPRTELLLLYASRIQLVEEVIKPALKQGIWVVSDRFELSTWAYQGGGRGLDMQFIQQLSAFSLQGFAPDLTIYLDISPELGLQRAALRGELDRMESQPLDFFARIHQTYEQHLNTKNTVRIDASQALNEVQKQIISGLDSAMEQF